LGSGSAAILVSMIARVDQLHGPRHALGLLGFVVVDLVGGGDVDPVD
jgi:hypothetical protein